MNIQADELKYKKERTVSFFGKQLDMVSLISFMLGIILSVLVWFYFGLYQKGYNRYFLYALCAFFVIQIYMSGTYVASFTVEDNEIKEIVQVNAVIFSSLVILLAFSSNPNFSADDNKMIVIALFFTLLGVIYYSSPKDPYAKRTIRKLKTAFMTISIFLLLNMLFNLAVNKFELLG
jgi:hypothetical protein